MNSVLVVFLLIVSFLIIILSLLQSNQCDTSISIFGSSFNFIKVKERGGVRFIIGLMFVCSILFFLLAFLINVNN